VPFRDRSADLSHIFQLNEVAGFVWNALESATSADDLVQKVITTFEVEDEEARRDVIDLLETLENAGLVRTELHGS
jgi:hypothetical protein